MTSVFMVHPRIPFPTRHTSLSRRFHARSGATKDDLRALWLMWFCTLSSHDPLACMTQTTAFDKNGKYVSVLVFASLSRS